MGRENVRDWRHKFFILCAFQAGYFSLIMLDIFVGGISTHGIRPRDVRSLPWSRLDDHVNSAQSVLLRSCRIFLAPFVHKDLMAYLTTIMPFFVLGGFVLLREGGRHVFWTLATAQTLLGVSLHAHVFYFSNQHYSFFFCRVS